MQIFIIIGGNRLKTHRREFVGEVVPESSSQTGEWVVCRDALWVCKGAGGDEKNKTNKKRFIYRRQLRSPSSSCASAVGVACAQVRSLPACTFDQRFVIGPSRFFCSPDFDLAL